jgi:NAD(P)-dependent dehydrogenase (short-subunit alcohol dehydrogenase family)
MTLAEGGRRDSARGQGGDGHRIDAGRATAAAVRAAGGEMTFVQADVADDTAVEAVVAMTVQTYGGLDCAVNNAGTEATGLIADSDDEVFDRLIAVNLKGLLLCLRHEITKGGVNALTKAAASKSPRTTSA